MLNSDSDEDSNENGLCSDLLVDTFIEVFVIGGLDIQSDTDMVSQEVAGSIYARMQQPVSDEEV